MYGIGAAAQGLSDSLKHYEWSRSREDQNYWAGASLQWQRELAKHGVRWRVADAKAAGLHPLAALGVNVASGTPVRTFAGTSGAGEGLARMGQYIDRVFDKMRRAQVEAQELDNQYKRELIKDRQMERMGQGPNAPRDMGGAMEVLGSDAANIGSGVNLVPNQVAWSGSPGIAAGVHPGEVARRQGKHIWFELPQLRSESMEQDKTALANYLKFKKDRWDNMQKYWDPSKRKGRGWRIFKSQLEAMRKGFGRPPEGYEYRLDPVIGKGWRLYKIGRGGSRIYGMINRKFNRSSEWKRSRKFIQDVYQHYLGKGGKWWPSR